MRRPLTAVLVGMLLTTLLTAAASAAPPPGKGWNKDPQPVEPAPAPVGNPFTDTNGWVDPYSQAAQAVARAESEGRTTDASLLRRISETPQAAWWGDWNATSTVRQAVAERTAEIRAAGRLPLYVTYAIPSRDCGQYSSGGMNSPDGYRAWMREFAAGLGGGPAAVVLEPDALAQLDCLSRRAQGDRLQLLKEAVDLLASDGVAVYLDAGNSGWQPAAVMADRLAKAGVANARGFSLNVSNYNWTADEIAYGRNVSSVLGGTPFVVDTSRNGNGPATEGAEPWCNPTGRALGSRPDAVPAAGVDAYVWVKRPGESDGTCNGGPAAGQWFEERALEQAANAGW